MTDPFPSSPSPEPRGDSLCPVVGGLLIFEALLLGALSLVCFPTVLSSLLGQSYSSLEVFRIHLIQLGLGCSALTIGAWGCYELFLRRPGPLVLAALVFLLPLILPCFFLGYGSSTDAWEAALAGWRIASTGSPAPALTGDGPFYLLLARWVVPWGLWPAMLVLNTLAGTLAVCAWLLLPKGIPAEKCRMIALAFWIHPLILLGCGVSLGSIWQTLFLTAALVAAMRRIGAEEGPRWGPFALAGGFLGLSVGFGTSSAGALPLFLILPLFGPPAQGRKGVAVAAFTGVFLAVVGLVALLAPDLSGVAGGPLQASASPPAELLAELLRVVLPPPLLALLLIAPVGLLIGWPRLRWQERLLAGWAIGLVLILFPTFLARPGRIEQLTVLVPAFSILVGLSVPRLLLAGLLPWVLAWNVVSVPVLVTRDQAWSLDLHPTSGPMVAETLDRFVALRQAEKVLMADPGKRTVFLVGKDWPILAGLKPEWVRDPAERMLQNPRAPVTFVDWLERDRFEALKAEGVRILVVGDSDTETRSKFGYDPLAEGAAAWTPTMRFYR